MLKELEWFLIVLEFKYALKIYRFFANGEKAGIII
jgi:hypothetical protein